MPRVPGMKQHTQSLHAELPECPQKHISSPLAIWDFKVAVFKTGKPACLFFQHFWCRTTCSVVLLQLKGKELGEMERWGFCDALLPFPFVS